MTRGARRMFRQCIKNNRKKKYGDSTDDEDEFPSEIIFESTQE
ncbi:MAG: hypothetical protein ACTSQD_09930 [Promethearchaeota archaeon]